MKKFLLLFFVMIVRLSYAKEFKEVETIVDTFPSKMKTPEKLAEMISSHFKTDEEKAVAAYIWIAKNIRYDVKGYLHNKYDRELSFSGKTKEEIEAKIQENYIEMAEKTIRKETGVCENFSRLYERVCKLVGLQVEVVRGYSKNEIADLGKMPSSIDHAWNKVKINDEWKYMDATWGAGYADFGRRKFIERFSFDYCLLPLERISLNHIDENQPKINVAQQRKNFSMTPFFFGAFVGSEMELLEPNVSMVALRGKKVLSMKIKKFPKTAKVSYFVESNPLEVLDTIEYQDDIATLNMPIHANNGGVLYIYLNDNPLLATRVSLR